MKAKSDLPKLNLELVDMSAKEKYLHAVEGMYSCSTTVLYGSYIYVFFF